MANAVSALSKSNPYSNLQSSSNPFTGSEGVYKTSRWQAFLSSLGFRTQADAWNENMQVQSQEYAAALAQKAYDEQYNLPVNQVARMRAAGLNPDLNGGDSIDSGSAQPLGEDPSTPMQSTGDEGAIMSAANTIMSAISTGFAVAKDIGTLKNMHIMNDQGMIETGERVAKFAKWITDQNKITQQGSSYEDFREHLSAASEDSYQIHSGSVPKRFQKQFKRNLDTFYHSLDYAVESLESQKKKNQGMKDVAQQTISKFFGGSDLETWQVVNKGLVRLSDLGEEASLRAVKNTAEYNADFAENLNSVANAQAQNESALAEAQSSKLSREINSVLADMVHDLKSLADKGDIFAQSMLFSFSLARMSNISFGPKGVKLGFSGNF